MANTDNPNGFSLRKSVYGEHARMKFPVAASQTISAGDAVILVSGLVQIAVLTSGAILGVAAHDIVTGGSVTRFVDQDTLLVDLALPGNIFEGQVSGSTVATTLGSEADIEGATGVMEINENASVEDVVQIVRLMSDISADLTIGANDRVQFIFKRSQFSGILAAI